MYSKTCVRQPPLKLTLVVDVERWLSYKGTCHVMLHDMYLYKTDNFFHISHYLKSVLKVALLHRFYCSKKWEPDHWVRSVSWDIMKKILIFFAHMCEEKEVLYHTIPFLTTWQPTRIKMRCSNHRDKESTPWRSCQRVNIYLQAMRNLVKPDNRR